LEAQIVALKGAMSQKQATLEETAATFPERSDLQEKIMQREAELSTARTAMQGAVDRSQAFESRIAELEIQLQKGMAAPDTKELEGKSAAVSPKWARPRVEGKLGENVSNESLPTETEAMADVEDLKVQLEKTRASELTLAAKNKALEKQLANRNRAINLAQKSAGNESQAPASPREAELVAELKQLKRLVDSATTAELAASNESSTLQSRVDDLESELNKRLAVEGSNSSAESDPWVEFSEMLRNAPDIIREWIREVPGNIKMVITATLQQLTTAALDILDSVKEEALRLALAGYESLGRGLSSAAEYGQEAVAKATYSNLEAAAKAANGNLHAATKAIYSNVREQLFVFWETTRAVAQREIIERMRTTDPQLFIKVGTASLSLLGACLFYFFHRCQSQSSSTNVPKPTKPGSQDDDLAARRSRRRENQEKRTFQALRSAGVNVDSGPMAPMVTLLGRKRPPPLLMLDLDADVDMDPAKEGKSVKKAESVVPKSAHQGRDGQKRTICIWVVGLACVAYLSCMGYFFMADPFARKQLYDTLAHLAAQASAHAATFWQHLLNGGALAASHVSAALNIRVAQVPLLWVSVRKATMDAPIGLVLVSMLAYAFMRDRATSIFQSPDLLLASPLLHATTATGHHPLLHATTASAAAAFAAAACWQWRQRRSMKVVVPSKKVSWAVPCATTCVEEQPMQGVALTTPAPILLGAFAEEINTAKTQQDTESKILKAALAMDVNEQCPVPVFNMAEDDEDDQEEIPPAVAEEPVAVAATLAPVARVTIGCLSLIFVIALVYLCTKHPESIKLVTVQTAMGIALGCTPSQVRQCVLTLKQSMINASDDFLMQARSIIIKTSAHPWCNTAAVACCVAIVVMLYLHKRCKSAVVHIKPCFSGDAGGSIYDCSNDVSQTTEQKENMDPNSLGMGKDFANMVAQSPVGAAVVMGLSLSKQGKGGMFASQISALTV